MTLYYCTICALYPCFYVDKFLSAESPVNTLKTIDSEKDLKLPKKINNNNEDELETTSEGLCDFVRELFYLDRPVFNEYQIKALKKLLLRKSHSQVSRDY
jgi:hypothetical protein